MGFKKPLDFNSISHQIWIAGVELKSSRNDGYTCWSIKQDLLELLHLLNNVLDDSPKFPDEDKFLEELEQKRVIRVLKK
jgi:hypothetical protein